MRPPSPAHLVAEKDLAKEVVLKDKDKNEEEEVDIGELFGDD